MMGSIAISRTVGEGEALREWERGERDPPGQIGLYITPHGHTDIPSVLCSLRRVVQKGPEFDRWR